MGPGVPSYGLLPSSDERELGGALARGFFTIDGWSRGKKKTYIFRKL